MSEIKIFSSVRTGLNRFHVYHLLNPSIWPLAVSGGIFSIVISLISSFFVGCIPGSTRVGGFWFFSVDPSLFFSVLTVGFIAFCWWSDVSSESGEHTRYTIRGLK